MGIRTSKQVEVDDFLEVFGEENKRRHVSRADFKIIRQISNQTGKSKLFQVESLKDQQPYFMKQLSKFEIYDQREIERVHRELSICSLLMNTKYVVNLHYAFQDLNYLYLIHDYKNGPNLTQLLKNMKVNRVQIEEAHAQFIFSYLLLGLEYLHKNNIIVLGLRPENILFDDEGYPCISGFQHAIIENQRNNNRQYDFIQSQEDDDIVNDDLITPYLAPEVFLKQKPSFEADFYSLGMVLYEIITGERAFYNNLNGATLKKEEERQELIKFILQQKTQILKAELREELDPTSADLVNKLILKKPENRTGFYGIEDIKKHGWLKNFPWQKIQDRFIKKYGLKKQNSALAQKTINQNVSDLLSQQNQDIVNTIQFQEKFERFYYSSDDPNDFYYKSRIEHEKIIKK
ncbi:hypothetical protein ABPG72_007094 [Tetrahymena utriculariae]